MDEEDLRWVSGDYPDLMFLMSWTRWRGSDRVLDQGGWAFRAGRPVEDVDEAGILAADIEPHDALSDEGFGALLVEATE